MDHAARQKPPASAPSGESIPLLAPVVVSHVKVLSDKVEDVSSLDTWKQSFLKPGMTEQQKALAIWETVVKFRHQDAPPLELLDHEDQVFDPIKAFNASSSPCKAVACAALLGSAPFILVTSAYHMPRALWLMRRAGAHPVPAPVGQRALGMDGELIAELIPGSMGLYKTEHALHEYIGLLAITLGLD